MTRFARTIEERLYQALGVEKRRSYGVDALGMLVPLAVGVFAGGVIGMMYAPKAGRQLRGDVQEWFKTREQNLRQGAQDMLNTNAPAQHNGEPIEVDTGRSEGHNGR